MVMYCICVKYLCFLFQTNVNAELTAELQKEQHLNQELAAKLSDIGVELEEKKTQVKLSSFCPSLLALSLN